MGLKREWAAERKKLRNMKPREAVSYLWSYYKIHLLLFALALFFLALIWQAYFGKKPEAVFSALLVDTGITQEAADAAARAYETYSGYDGENQVVALNAGISFRGGTVAEVQKLVLSIAAGEADAVLTDAVVADYLLKSGALADLQVILPEETLARCGGRLAYADAAALRDWSEARRNGVTDDDTVLVSTESGGMAEPVPVGVDVTAACEARLGRPAGGAPVILCAAVTTRRQEKIARFLAFLDGQGDG